MVFLPIGLLCWSLYFLLQTGYYGRLFWFIYFETSYNNIFCRIRVWQLPSGAWSMSMRMMMIIVGFSEFLANFEPKFKLVCQTIDSPFILSCVCNAAYYPPSDPSKSASDQLAEASRSLPSIFLRLLDNHLQGGLWGTLIPGLLNSNPNGFPHSHSDSNQLYSSWGSTFLIWIAWPGW